MTTDKNLRILHLRDAQNLTFSYIGKIVGMTPGAARAIYHKYKAREEGPLKGLTGRAITCIEQQMPWVEADPSITEDHVKNEIRKRIESHNWWPFKRMRNYGMKTHCEIMAWLNNNQSTTEPQ